MLDVSRVCEVKLKLRHGNKRTSPGSELNESVHKPDRCKNWELLVLELIIHPLEEVVASPIAGMHRGTCDRIGKNIGQIALLAVRPVILLLVSFLASLLSSLFISSGYIYIYIYFLNFILSGFLILILLSIHLSSFTFFLSFFFFALSSLIFLTSSFFPSVLFL